MIWKRTLKGFLLGNDKINILANVKFTRFSGSMGRIGVVLCSAVGRKTAIVNSCIVIDSNGNDIDSDTREIVNILCWALELDSFHNIVYLMSFQEIRSMNLRRAS